MKKLLLYLFLAASFGTLAQNNATTCPEAMSLCGALGEPFANTTNSPPASPVIDYGCLGSQPNPYWFYFQISQAGWISFDMSQTSLNGNPVDVDYICYGPFTSVADACTNAGPANEVGCSYSAAAEEHLDIPNAQVGDYYILMVTNFSNQPGTITITPGANASGAIDCNGIHLNAFFDSNANGTQDTGENGFPFGSFSYDANNSGNPDVAISSNGNYAIYDEVLTNTYDISYAVDPAYAAYYTVTTPSYEDIQVMPGSAITTYNFPVTATTPYQDVAVYVIPNSPPMPGFTYTNTIVYTNLGNMPAAAGTVTFTKDPLATITSVSEPGVVMTPTGFEFNYPGLAMFETGTIVVEMEVPVIPVVNLDDTLTTSASITLAEGDVAPDNNLSSNTQIIVGSYDPNDKMESRGRYIYIDEFSEEDYLYYTIRFQNTGTAHAFNVRVEDLIDSQLDLESIEMIRASHDYTMAREGNKLIWRFADIMLPASEDDEPASHGYIYFKIKPNAGFEVDDIIPNTAEIYFDFNPAIITNTFNTQFINALSTEEFSSGSLTMYPNPANNMVTLAVSNNVEAIAGVKVFDVTGKTLFDQAGLNTQSFTFDVSAFGSGAYFVEIVSSANVKTVKTLLVK